MASPANRFALFWSRRAGDLVRFLGELTITMLRRHSAVITLSLCAACSALTVRVSGPIRRPAIQRTAAACFVAGKEESAAPDRRPPALALMGAAALLAVAMPLAAARAMAATWRQIGWA